MQNRSRSDRPLASGSEPEFGRALADASVLIVDDEEGMRNFVVRTLGPRCRRVVQASDSDEASAALDSDQFDVVIVDNVMPGQNGVDWLQQQRRAGFFSEAILITAYADLETAIEALRAGAADFVLKPFRSNQLLNAVARCLDRQRLARENYLLRYELRSSANALRARNELIGKSASIARIREILARLAPLPTSVLVTGESGSGKEVAARLLHTLSERAKRPFVPVNCAAIPAEMMESELFGHVKGAFTGAESQRQGLFLYAQGGTLFLDEIGELPLPMQSKLLRVLEDKRVRPVGAEREVPIDLRLVFATNADLEAAVAEGRFRQDLLYRINVVKVAMPPLRERREDVVELTELFMHKLSQELGVPPVRLDRATAAALTDYRWPGNVRELRNLVERALIHGSFPADWQGRRDAEREGEPPTLEAVEQRYIREVLASVGGNHAAAARILGVSRKTIDRKCQAWDD